MKRRWWLLVFACVLIAAASATATWRIWVSGYQYFEVAWTGAGTFDVTRDGVDAKICGEVLSATFNPGTGSGQPSDLHDITLIDAKGHDLLQGEGVDQTRASTGDAVRFLAPSAIYSTSALVVANCGTTGTGVVGIVVRGGIR